MVEAQQPGPSHPEPTALATRHVFLDTSVYFDANFAFDGKLLHAIRSASQSGLLTLVTTPITRKEVESNILQRASEALTALKQFSSKHYVLRNFAEYSIVFDRGANAAALAARHVAAFTEYLDDADAIDVPIDAVAVSRLFEDYFARRPPFGTEKSKSEFPDAFVVAALEAWCAAQPAEMYVVSGDEPMRHAAEAAPHLHPLGSLDELFRIINVGHLAEFVARALEEHTDRIEARVAAELDEGQFYVGGTDGELNEVTVDRVMLHPPVSVIEASDTEATVRCKATVMYDADITYDDPTTGTYDREDDVMLFVESKSEVVHEEDEVTVEATVRYPANQPFDFTVVEVRVNDGELIEVRPSFG